MGLETNISDFKSTSKKVMDCEIKDPSGLNDFQKLPEAGARSINKVGIERFRFPLRVKNSEGEISTHDAQASMFVYLEEGKTGVNMSRFCQILQRETQNSVMDLELFKKILLCYKDELRDYETEKFIPKSYLKLNYSIPMKQKSLVSDNWGWQYYNVELDGCLDENGQYSIKQSLDYEYSSTCPCSLSMSKQYEQDYAKGLTTEGNGIATAHGQRSLAKCSLWHRGESDFSYEEFVQIMKAALPTETQSLVKRVDEQAFAILNGEHPMFVEHATRRIASILDKDSRFFHWEASVEHFESLHSHNAVAYISKNS